MQYTVKDVVDLIIAEEKDIPNRSVEDTAEFWVSDFYEDINISISVIEQFVRHNRSLQHKELLDSLQQVSRTLDYSPEQTQQCLIEQLKLIQLDNLL